MANFIISLFFLGCNIKYSHFGNKTHIYDINNAIVWNRFIQSANGYQNNNCRGGSLSPPANRNDINRANVGNGGFRHFAKQQL